MLGARAPEQVHAPRGWRAVFSLRQLTLTRTSQLEKGSRDHDRQSDPSLLVIQRSRSDGSLRCPRARKPEEGITGGSDPAN